MGPNIMQPPAPNCDDLPFNRMQAAGRLATEGWVTANMDALRRNGIRVDGGLYNMLHAMFVAGWHARDSFRPAGTP